MTWPASEVARLLRRDAGTACADYQPDHNGECQTCDEAYDLHLLRAAAELLDYVTQDRAFWERKAGDEHALVEAVGRKLCEVALRQQRAYEVD